MPVRKFSANHPFREEVCLVSSMTVLHVMPKTVNCSLSKVIRPGGTAKQGRNRTFQAILPLRGKILNVEKAMDHKILDNQEITSLYRAMRVTIGTEDDPYGHQYLTPCLSQDNHHD